MEVDFPHAECIIKVTRLSKKTKKREKKAEKKKAGNSGKSGKTRKAAAEKKTEPEYRRSPGHVEKLLSAFL
jgi:hypothetical protein